MLPSRKRRHLQTRTVPSKPRVFIVEDEIVIVRGLEMAIEGLGYSVCGFAFSGEEAMTAIGAQRPDLILVDIHLRGEMDGIELADKIASRFAIPVIYITAYSDREILERAKITDPSGYIVKPVRDRQLQVSIELALERRRRERDKTAVLERYRKTIEHLQIELDERTRGLEAAGKALSSAKKEVARKTVKLEELRLELQEVNKSLINVAAHMARTREELELELAAALRLRGLPILSKLRSDPAFEHYRTELDMLTMHMGQLSMSLTNGAQTFGVLSTSELRVAALTKDGLTSEEVAERLHLSPATVKTHRRSIRKKLGIQRTHTNLSTHLLSRWGQ